MYSRFFSRIGVSIASFTLLTTTGVVSAQANSKDNQFFEGVAGSWAGPGEIVAGKYKGTKFSCNLAGEPIGAKETGIKLEGTCRVGVFKQPMSAVITKKGNSYSGQFLDGGAGKGLDIVSGQVTGNKVVVGINRASLNGAMVARMDNDKAMNITISVKVGEQMVPVIGLSLGRELDTIAVGSIR
jgi:hypothetical protein